MSWAFLPMPPIQYVYVLFSCRTNLVVLKLINTLYAHPKTHGIGGWGVVCGGGGGGEITQTSCVGEEVIIIVMVYWFRVSMWVNCRWQIYIVISNWLYWPVFWRNGSIHCGRSGGILGLGGVGVGWGGRDTNNRASTQSTQLTWSRDLHNLKAEYNWQITYT